jgi:hypothetical protein
MGGQVGGDGAVASLSCDGRGEAGGTKMFQVCDERGAVQWM